jgi:hypothetical protein
MSTDRFVMNGLRRTGRTFRACCRSLEWASAGRHVFFIVPNTAMKRYVFDKCATITQAAGCGKVFLNKAKILFPSGGCIVFYERKYYYDNQPILFAGLNRELIKEVYDS